MSGLSTAILDLQLKTISGDVVCSTIESGTLENMGRSIAVGIFLIAALEPEISWGVILPPPRLPKTVVKNRYRYGLILCLGL